MVIKRENLWELPLPDYICVPTNANIWSSRLVMGKGFALQVKYRYPQCEHYFAGAIKSKSRKPETFTNTTNVYENYYLIEIKFRGQNFILFQTKTDYRENSKIEITKEAAKRLAKLANNKPDKSFYLPCPGVGQGKLDEKTVLEAISFLPDNVTVFIHYVK